ncbi:hypothetical protein QLS71_012995 [Mariniflexile litorale]|uniref:Capsular polysaccharide export protein n=1 Tax=Mariniflexile litorale TaxID=3045158 RepID=A0AAU7ED20_9FLAO|nr:hypothetical protein [Mariniflexile sp. KMM 9835]MDQ8212226.1 hypothetical protein [Mariniflexile sp. KMM 9835]
MKKYILIYVYNSLSEEEIEFWEQINVTLKDKGYTLFLLFQILPKSEVNFIYAKFTERLEHVIYPKNFSKKDKYFDFSTFLEREKVWYGESNSDRLTAAKYLKFKYSKLIKELNPVLLVLGNGNHASDMILKDTAKVNQTPIIYIERGSLPKSWHTDSLGITAGTKIARTSLSNLKVDNSNSYKKYKPYYLKSKSTWWDQPSNKEQINIKKRYNIESNQNLILFANQLDNDTSNFLYNPFFSSNLKAFEWFCESLANNNLEGFVLVKKHPYYKGDNTVFQNVLKRYSLKGAWVDDIALFDCIEQADLICAVNSTMLFEALIYDKPVLQLGDSILNRKDVVYHLKSKTDYSTLQNWYRKESLQEKLDNYSMFMSYLIDNELSFFLKESKDMELNSVEFFVQKLLKFTDNSKQGSYPENFIKLNNYIPKDRLDKSFINKIKRIFNKIKKKN